MYAAPAAPGQEASAEAPADSPVIEEIRGDVVGEQMRLVTRVYAGESAAPIDPRGTPRRAWLLSRRAT